MMEFKLPDIGEGVHEGEITKWLVKAGDTIEADQPMVEVMTDKATVEIPSPVTGVVEALNFKEGQTVEVGKVILKIREGNGKSAPEAKQASAPKESKMPEPVRPEVAAQGARSASAPTKAAPVPEPETEALPFNILATPATRKLARDLSVDLRQVKGTGPHDRVTKDDVQQAYEGRQAAAPRTSHPAPATARAPVPAITPPATKAVVHVERGAIKTIPLKGIRKKIAESMAHSKHTAAHFTYVEEVDMSAIVRLRESAKEEAKARGVKLTFLPFIIKAVIPALVEFPFLNASLDDEKQEIILKGDYNIGIATDTPNGLMVPVIKAADRKSIWELASEITTLTDKARAGKSALDELKGGTFTLTNAGSIGGVLTTPVINHPEVGILGVNAIRKRPIVKDDQIVIADIMYLSLSVDHRVADGADAARFVNRIVYFLSDPTRLVFA